MDTSSPRERPPANSGVVLTLVASDLPLSASVVERVCAVVDGTAHWLAPAKAVDIECLSAERGPLEELLAPVRVDLFVQPQGNRRRKRLLVTDMDSTLVCEETLDELAAAVGLKEKIAAITERSMRGELAFEEAIHARIELLKGLPESAVAGVLEAISLTPGARELVCSMRAAGAVTVLVSGGFSCFTEPISRKLGIDHHHGNHLVFADGVVTGEIREPILGRTAKRQVIERWCAEYGIPGSDVLAVGDGANDLEMLQAAGLGVGFHPKPFLRKAIENSIVYGDLTALLYAQGFHGDEISACS